MEVVILSALKENRKYIFGLLLALISWQAVAQNCNCPPVATCSACQGGINSLTLRYDGILLPALITALDDDGEVYSGLISPGQSFSFDGSLPDGRFQGNQITLAVDGIYNAIIDTSCGSAVYVNSSYGSFTVMGGASINGGALCCAASDLDAIPPVISSCPANINVSASATACSAAVSWSPPTVTDNCGSFNITGSHNPGASFPLGTTTVSYTATDNYGNISSCSFNITVEDNTPPTLNSCPLNITVAANQSCQAPVSWTPPTATDNCSPVVITKSHQPGVFPIGTTVVTYTATDNANNSTTCTFNVVVEDKTPPVFQNCPADISATADANSCQAIVQWTEPTFTDNCEIAGLLSSHLPGDAFSPGITAVTYTATDGANNSTVCTFNVIVEDKTPPVFQNCPSDITIDADASSCEVIVQWTEPTFSDNCENGELTSSHQPGDSFPLGTTVVEYKATDASGNAAYCSFNVIVKGDELPVITDCPADIRAEAGESGEVSVTWTPPTASSRCGNVSLTSSHNPGDLFPVGTTKVEYKAIDDSGNEVLCTFNVVITYIEIAFEVAQVITPNGDGVNDEWIITDLEYFRNNKVTVFDRWGSVIYRASGYNNGSVVWKGENTNGTIVPTGTYFYTIEVNLNEENVKKNGFIELVQ